MDFSQFWKYSFSFAKNFMSSMKLNFKQIKNLKKYHIFIHFYNFTVKIWNLYIMWNLNLFKLHIHQNYIIYIYIDYISKIHITEKNDKKYIFSSSIFLDFYF